MGAYLSKVLPDWILVISLVVLLAVTTKTTLDKGFEQFSKESQEFMKAQRSALVQAMSADDEYAESCSLLRDDDEDAHRGGTDTDDESAPAIAAEVQKEYVDPRLTALLAEESSTPMDKVYIISAMIITVIVLNFLKGGSGNFPSVLGIQCGSSSYWFLTLVVFVVILAVSYYSRSLLIEKWKLKKELHYQYVAGDVEWNERNTLVYPAICFFAGFFAGLFGVGGGIVKGPLMLQMGVHPLVASGTTAVMIMFTSAAATTMFIAFGTLTWDYAIFLFIIGLATTIIGQFGVSYLVKKYKRTSLVSLSIGAVVAISTILMAIQSIFTLIDAEEGRGESISLCGN